MIRPTHTRVGFVSCFFLLLFFYSILQKKAKERRKQQSSMHHFYIIVYQQRWGVSLFKIHILRLVVFMYSSSLTFHFNIYGWQSALLQFEFNRCVVKLHLNTYLNTDTISHSKIVMVRSAFSCIWFQSLRSMHKTFLHEQKKGGLMTILKM